MNLFTKIAPQWALRRAIARNRLSRLDNIDVKRNTTARQRMNIDNLYSRKNANSDVYHYQESRRNNVRALEYNNPFVSGPIRRIANNVVGTGFILNSKASDEELRNTIEKYYKIWSRPDNCDKRKILSLDDMLRIAEMALIRDGESLIVGSYSNDKRRFTKYTVNIFEIDRLQTPLDKIRDRNVINGVKYNRDGAPETYYILMDHPGNTQTFIKKDFMEIPAYFDNGERRVIHLFNPTRAEQLRGLTELCSSLDYFENLDKYSQAEIYAAIEDACLTGFIKSEDPDNWADGNTETEGDKKIHEFAVNQIYYLNPNEDITYHTPTRPNNQFGEMVNQLLRGPANGLDTPPEVISQNFHGMNYSNARTVLLQFQHAMRIRQRHLLTYASYYIFRNFIDSLILDEILDPRIDIEDSKQHGWIAPGWQWVDPKKEADGKTTEWENNIESLSDIIASRGKDPDEVFERILRDKQRLKEHQKILGESDENTKADVKGTNLSNS